MGKEVLKDALRCLTGERDCNICYYNDLAEERDTCCINVIAEEALEYIEQLERKLKDYQDKIENGTLIEANKPFIVLNCISNGEEYYAVRIAEEKDLAINLTKAEAEEKLKELQNER